MGEGEIKKTETKQRMKRRIKNENRNLRNRWEIEKEGFQRKKEIESFNFFCSMRVGH